MVLEFYKSVIEPQSSDKSSPSTTRELHILMEFSRPFTPQLPLNISLQVSAVAYTKTLHKEQPLKLAIAFHVKMYWAEGLLYDMCPLYENPQRLPPLSAFFFLIDTFIYDAFPLLGLLRSPQQNVQAPSGKGTA